MFVLGSLLNLLFHEVVEVLCGGERFVGAGRHNIYKGRKRRLWGSRWWVTVSLMKGAVV